MRFSRLIYPAPNPPSYSQDRLVGEILYVPKTHNSASKSGCLNQQSEALGLLNVTSTTLSSIRPHDKL